MSSVNSFSSSDSSSSSSSSTSTSSSSRSSSPTGQVMTTQAVSDDSILAISDFVVNLLATAPLPANGGEASQKLRNRIQEIRTNPASIEILNYKEIKELKNSFTQMIDETEELTPKEREFCKQLIDIYLITPGYKNYQSFFRAHWTQPGKAVNLTHIQTFLKKIEGELDRLKLSLEGELRIFKTNLEQSIRTAQGLHDSFQRQFAQEQKPQFNREAGTLVCTLEQLEYATEKASKLFSPTINKAQSSEHVAQLTLLIQIILCGDEVMMTVPPTNSVCFLLRETHDQVSAPIQLSGEVSEEETSSTSSSTSSAERQTVENVQAHLQSFFSDRLPKNLIVEILTEQPGEIFHTGQLRFFLPNWQYPFTSQWLSIPVGTATVTLCEGQPMTEDQPGTRPTLVMSNLRVNWAAPLPIRENLVSYMLDPDLNPHQFTHPLTGSHLNRFADQLLLLYPQLHVEDTEIGHSIDNLSPTDIVSFKIRIQRARDLTAQIKVEMTQNHDDDNYEFNDQMDAFIREMLDSVTSSPNVAELVERLRELTNGKEYPEVFLQKLHSILIHRLKDLIFIAGCRTQFRQLYHAALENVFGKFQMIRTAFLEEKDPEVDSQTGAIAVPLSRLRLAKLIFEKHYRWLVECADNKYEEALATHILATIICGKAAPAPALIKDHPRCFVIREFADHPVELIEHTLALDTGVSYNQHLLGEIAGQKEVAQPEQFRASVLNATHLLVSDAIVRNRYVVRLGELEFTTQFTSQEDLTKPFYVTQILNRFRAYMNAHPAAAQKIRQTPLANLVKNHLKVRDFCELLSTMEATGVPKTTIQRIIDYLQQVPEDSQDLVVLKLVELMCFMNQHISIIFGGFLKDLCKEIPDGDSSSHITYNAEAAFEFSLDSQTFDSIESQGTVIFLLRRNAVKSKNDAGKSIYLTPPPTQPAQMSFSLRVPSLTETAHPNGRDCPALSFSRLAVNACAPLALLDLLSTYLNETYTIEEVANTSDYSVMKGALIDIMVELGQLDKFLAEGVQNKIIAFSLSKFLAAYKAIKRIEIQQLLLNARKDATIIKQIKNDLDQTRMQLKRAYQKLSLHFHEDAQVREIIDLFDQIHFWFPSLK